MTLTTAPDRTLMSAENRVHHSFLAFVETIASAERKDFFDPRNADDWVRSFGEWLVEEQRKSAERRASND